jgi:hypothetical protein
MTQTASSSISIGQPFVGGTVRLQLVVRIPGLPDALQHLVLGGKALHGLVVGQTVMVLWRDPKSREQQGLTVATEAEAETPKRLLDANGQSFEIAQHAIFTNQARVPTVADVIQEHIDLLFRPSSGTTRTYQVMLDLHVWNVIGHIPVDKLDYRHIKHWVKSMRALGQKYWG